MNIKDAMRANGLIEQRGELLSKLELLKRMAGFPIGSLTYLNNSTISVSVSISKEMQSSIESLMAATLRGQIALLEQQLEALGVSTGEEQC